MTRIVGALAAALAALAALEALLAHHGPGLAWWHRVPGLQGVYGLIGCVAIVVASKWLGRRWLQRPEGDDG